MSLKLYKHQQQLIDDAPRYHGLFFEVGAGKSVTAIRLAEKHATSCLVVCPKSVKQNWWREIAKWSTNPDTDWRVATKEEFKKELVFLAGQNLKGLIIDEAHNHSGYKSQLYKNTIKYLNLVKPNCVYALTGTPYLSSPYNAMCIENMLGHKANWLDYKRRFFHDVRMGARVIPVVNKGIEPAIAEIVNRIGTTVRKEDCLDLPDKVYLREDFELTAEQNKAMKDLELDPMIVNHITYWTKAHQICGGTMKGHDGKPAYFKSEKADRIVEYSNTNKKFAVVCRYNAEIDNLKAILAGKNVYVLRGDTKDRQTLLDEVNDADEAIILINASVCEGYNLTGINLMLFYSHSFSFKDLTQMKGRIHRIGQQNKCTYIELVVRGSIDEDVLRSLDKKQDFDVAIYSRENKI